MASGLIEFNIGLAHGVMTVGMIVLMLALVAIGLYLCVKVLDAFKSVQVGVKLYWKFRLSYTEFAAMIERIEKEREENDA